MDSQPDEREQLFKVFARALFTRDIDLLYSVATPDFCWSYHDGIGTVKRLVNPAAVRDHLAEQQQLYESQRFHDVVYHHLPDVSFMTFRVTERLRSTGETRAQQGIERYLFKDGRIALKDVYRKPTQVIVE